MKYLIFFILIIFSLSKGFAQCQTETYTQKGIKELQKGGFTFLKSYPINNKNGRKYSYIFSTGAKYLIKLSQNERSQGVMVTLYNSNNKLIASNFVNGKVYSEILYSCKTTGIYHMIFTFENTEDYCAAGVLGMKR